MSGVCQSICVRVNISREWGFLEDRDVNAALNILQKGLSTVGHIESHAWGDTPSSCVGEILHDYCESLNQESPLQRAQGVST